MPSADEKEICYWCNDCQRFVQPDRLHNGEDAAHKMFNVADYDMPPVKKPKLPKLVCG